MTPAGRAAAYDCFLSCTHRNRTLYTAASCSILNRIRPLCRLVQCFKCFLCKGRIATGIPLNVPLLPNPLILAQLLRHELWHLAQVIDTLSWQLNTLDPTDAILARQSLLEDGLAAACITLQLCLIEKLVLCQAHRGLVPSHVVVHRLYQLVFVSLELCCFECSLYVALNIILLAPSAFNIDQLRQYFFT